MSTITKKLNNSRKLFFCCFGLFISIFFTGCFYEKKSNLKNQEVISSPLPLKTVAALGQISPDGEIRKLAAPISGFGGTPRISELLVKVGEKVQKGQILAVFDNRPRVLSDLNIAETKISTLEKKITIQKDDLKRYQIAASQGAASIAIVDNKKLQLIKLIGEMEEIKAQIIGLQVDLKESQLRSPLNGVVLRIHTRVGERTGSDGVLEIGATKLMQALIEVYESDISKIKMGQRVSLVSENGGFEGTLRGRVIRISPQVRQRQVLSTDPTGDADARIIEVQVKLDPDSAKIVEKLTGIKVIARFLD